MLDYIIIFQVLDKSINVLKILVVWALKYV